MRGNRPLLTGALSHPMHLRNFPFDRQELQLVVETPYLVSELRLVPNRQDSAVSELLNVQAFEITGLRLDEHVERYDTNFGLRDAAGQFYSRLIVRIDLKRNSERIVVLLLVGFIVANLIGLLTYAAHVSMPSIRSSMSIGAIFGAVGNLYFLERTVNPAAGSLIVDRVATVGFAGIAIAILTGIVLDGIYRWEKIGLARLVDWSIFSVVLIGTIVYLSQAYREAVG